MKKMLLLFALVVFVPVGCAHHMPSTVSLSEKDMAVQKSKSGYQGLLASGPHETPYGPAMGITIDGARYSISEPAWKTLNGNPSHVTVGSEIRFELLDDPFNLSIPHKPGSLKGEVQGTKINNLLSIVMHYIQKSDFPDMSIKITMDIYGSADRIPILSRGILCRTNCDFTNVPSFIVNKDGSKLQFNKIILNGDRITTNQDLAMVRAYIAKLMTDTHKLFNRPEVMKTETALFGEVSDKIGDRGISLTVKVLGALE